MSCPQCRGIEREFNHKVAARDLQHYRKKGPVRTTRMLIDALKGDRIAGQTLLDIGGGVGAIHHEMLRAGIAHVTSVDASRAYLEAAEEEANRIGLKDKVIA